MKARDEVRVETERAARIAGYALLSLGFMLALVAGVVAPLLDKHVDLPWFLSVIFIGAGIPLSFPRSALGHAIVGRADAILDKFVPKSAP